MSSEVTDAMIDAAVVVLSQYFDIGGYAHVSDFLNDFQTPSERESGIYAMQEADILARAVMRERICETLEAALNA